MLASEGMNMLRDSVESAVRTMRVVRCGGVSALRIIDVLGPRNKKAPEFLRGRMENGYGNPYRTMHLWLTTSTIVSFISNLPWLKHKYKSHFWQCAFWAQYGRSLQLEQMTVGVLAPKSLAAMSSA